MEILAVVGIIAAAVVGFVFGKKNSASELEKNRLQQQLKEKTSEMESFHAKVNTHFEKTAELFNHVSDSYQSLYDHMAKSSNQLCASQTFQVLPKSSQTKIETNAEAPHIQKSDEESSSNLFDPDQLYQAHEYRNHTAKEDEQQIESKEQPVEDNNVVKIAKAKEEQDAQALDYAIKAKGVVNHNSLDVESIKNS